MSIEQPTKTLWRSLDDLADTPEFRAFTAKEFPGFANVFEGIGEAEIDEVDGLSRRTFMSLSAAGLGLAGMAGCRRPDLQILPYSQVPDNVVPGKPNYVATSIPRAGGALPVLVELHEGRPTKIEGHPTASASLGKSDLHAQASILDLYSPERSKDVVHNTIINKEPKSVVKSWTEFDYFVSDHFGAIRSGKKDPVGTGLRFLSEEIGSPAIRAVRANLAKAYPGAVWHTYESVDASGPKDGAKLAFGKPVVALYAFEKALRVVSLDSDFLETEPNAVANARGFAALRKEPDHSDHDHSGHDHKHDISKETSRLYVVESGYSLTGGMADHRLRIPAAHVADYAIALAKQVASLKAVALPAALQSIGSPAVTIPKAWLEQVAKDLAAFTGKSLVVAGTRQPAVVHAVCAFINEALGNAGKTVVYREAPADDAKNIVELADAMRSGSVSTLVIVGGNPVSFAPADVKFAEALEKVKTVVRFGLFDDETSKKSTWHLPLAHFLESFGDAEAPDGTYLTQQPMIAPLHGGRTVLEALIHLTGFDGAGTYAESKYKAFALLQKTFAERSKKSDDLAFKSFRHEGYLKGSAWPVSAATVKLTELGGWKSVAPIGEGNLEIAFSVDYSVYDGRYATNGWLMELPDPITKLVWDNAALISPVTAAKLGFKTGDVVEIEANGGKTKAAIFVQPGQADNSLSLSIGYGKLRIAKIPTDCGGFDAAPIRSAKAMWFAAAKVTKLAETYRLVTTQEHGVIPEGREEIVKQYSLSKLEAIVHAAHHEEKPKDAAQAKPEVHEHHEPNFKENFQYGYAVAKKLPERERLALDLSYPEKLDSHLQWGMVIDLNTCTGCSACVVACQAENNIPIVGKNEIRRNREMHWLRIDRYFTTSFEAEKNETNAANTTMDDVRIVSQPMMCQHCEAAPCESVCPVNAAVHSPEGLNLQVYNRCIGTRYCSNNCPYKVRRFNWFDFNKRQLDQLRVPTPFAESGVPETLKMQKNPEVTVRMRGVMEKCTYCVQRIEAGKIGAKVAASKAGQDKKDAPVTADPSDLKTFKSALARELAQGFGIRQYDGVSKIVVPDGIIATACEQACPTGAIVFGNVNDENSRVYKLKQKEEEYLVLGSVNTKPRTSYLPRLRNLNVAMADPVTETPAAQSQAPRNPNTTEEAAQ